MQGHVAIAAPAGGDGDAQLFAQTRMFRIKQTNSLDFSTALPTSPRRYPHSATPHFFMKFRGPQALPNRPRNAMVRPTSTYGFQRLRAGLLSATPDGAGPE